MKVNLDLENKNINFEGYKPVKTSHGYKQYEFNYVYDDENYDCYVEFFSVKKDKGNYIPTGILKNSENPDNSEFGVKLESGKPTRIDVAGDYKVAPDEAFGYHYKLYPKNQRHSPHYVLDAGNVIVPTGKPEDKYNIISDKAPTVARGGSMKLIIPDNNNVSWVYDDKNNIVKNKDIERARKTNKNFANKIGGSLAGIEKDLDDGKLDKFTRIITTPLFTDDSLSAHAYWNKNNFQMAHSLGNINNYASLQRKLFAKGINLVADGAMVNEGLEGVHFRHVLQWGDKSPYFYWFNISGLETSPLKMGVFGKRTEHITHRLVNSKYKYEQRPDGTVKISRNHNYESKKPTYLQIYDDRLVDAEKLSDKQLIKAYDKLLKNSLEINNHNDTVVPYSFRIDSETYKKNVEVLNEFNKKAAGKDKILRTSGQGTKVLSTFKYFGLDGKHEGGFETWDANPDIAKLSYITSHAETQKLNNILDPKEKKAKRDLLQRKHCEAQDYAVASALYWSRKTSQILRLNAAQHLRNIDHMDANGIYKRIENLSDGKVFPKDLDVTKDIVSNVLKNRYKLPLTEKGLVTYEDAVLRGLMDVPLDSIEVGDDIVSVLASPYMTKRASRENQIGVSRFDSYEGGNRYLSQEYVRAYEATDKMYTKEMYDFAKKILADVNSRLPEKRKLVNEYGYTTPYGKYVIPMLTEQIARYAIIRSVAPSAKLSYDYETGEISYDYKAVKNTSLLGMGIVSADPEDEALSLVKKLRGGILKLANTSDEKANREELVKALYRSIRGTSVESFRLSEMIVNRAQAGLDWRIDATKDVADIESVRNRKADFESTWDNIIKFWARFTDKVKEYHPDAYIAAEVTDEGEIYGKGRGEKSEGRYSSSVEAVKKLINEAGFTTTANYSYFSSDITKIFGKLFDYDGVHSPDNGINQEGTVLTQLASFIQSGPLESILYTYTFAGNHDKCRALEGYAMDMDMVYHADLSNKDLEYLNDYRRRAYKILHGMAWDNEPDMSRVNGYDYRRVSTLAIAKCESVASGMGKALNGNPRQTELYDKMLHALENISNGKHLGKISDAEGFGAKDYDNALDIVLDEMNYLDAKMSESERKDLKNKTFEEILKPAISKLKGQTSFLTALVGNPTLFAGDEYGSTGYETTTKNMFLQNRNIIHEEWAQEYLDKNKKVKNLDYKPFIAEYKKEIEDMYGLRARPELQPLNDGAPFILKEQDATYENKEGKKVGTKASALLRQSPDGKMTISVFNMTGLNHNFNESYKPEEITLDSISFDKFYDLGLDKGIRQGLKFVNADDPNDIYYTRCYEGQYFLKRHKDNKDCSVVVKDSTLVLYHDPSFTGRRRTMYNPQYNFVSKPYVNKQEKLEGSKLSLVH